MTTVLHNAPQHAAASPTMPRFASAPPTEQSYPVWRNDKLLVVADRIILHDCCVKCGEPGDGRRITKKFHWHHPALLLTILINLLVYVILALVLRKSITIQFSLCKAHRAVRNRNMAISLLLTLGGLAASVAGFAGNNGLVALAGLVTFFGGLIFTVLALPVLRAKRIENGYGYMLGCGEEFLARHQELPGD